MRGTSCPISSSNLEEEAAWREQPVYSALPHSALPTRVLKVIETQPESKQENVPQPGLPAAAPEAIARPPAGPAGWHSWSRDILISVAISLFIILFLYQPVRVEGTSMLPRLEDQDRLFINKFAYRFQSIQRGDVIVFLYPGDRTKSYIKRVIALPGDRLRIDRGTVYVNGRALDEPYVPIRFRDERSEPAMTIPQGRFWVMGDHRNISSDSRDFGPVPGALIYGKAALVYWPMDQAGVVR